MSLLLTKNCHYAILVAIEDGQHFQAHDDKDIYITSRLNLKLPRPVDDLIPPTTLISTKPTMLTDKPQWRTTLVYYVSNQILRRLRKRQAQITLEVITLPEKGSRDKIGSIILQMDEAKIVLMHDGKRDISQIQQFVVDKGDWLSISENTRTKVKAGIFIVEMPNNTDISDKEVGTPLQTPIRTTNHNNHQGEELGLEICSDVSDLLVNNNRNNNNSLLDDNEDEEDFEQDMMDRQFNDNDEVYDIEQDIIAIGSGLDKFSFYFRIIQASEISLLTNRYSNDVVAFLQYEFAERQFQCSAQYQEDKWDVLEAHQNIMFQGHLNEIKTWLTEQSHITVCLIIQDSDGKQDIIGFSEIYLKGRDIGIIQQSSLIYDCERIWCINYDKKFSKLQLEIGLINGWTNEE